MAQIEFRLPMNQRKQAKEHHGLSHGQSSTNKLILFGTELKEQYKQIQISISSIEWIPSLNIKFRLAYTRGNSVELQDISKFYTHIVIVGPSGSGKSTLAVHICQRWAEGKLFKQFNVVILVQLRDPAVQRARTIADLLPCEDVTVAQELASELMATNGHGVLWIFDGWDELPPHLQQDSIFHKLILCKEMYHQKQLCSESSIIVMSHPTSTPDFHLYAEKIDLLEFSPEKRRQYFTECLKGDTKTLESLLERIKENPVLQSSCYLPLNAALIAHIFKFTGHSLPNTAYEILSTVILNCVLCHFEREDRRQDLPVKLKSLDDLSRSEAVREPFQCLCKLAYRGILENNMTFSSSELPQGMNTFSLLQEIQSFVQSGRSVYFSFLHLKFQDALAAYYIATCLPASEQVSKLQQLFNQPHFSGVFQFYSAITKLQTPGIKEVVTRIVKEKSKPHLVSLIHCLYEAQDLSLCHYVAEQLDEWYGCLLYTSPSPRDATLSRMPSSA